MKFAQFVALNFGKSVLRHLRLLPDATSANSSRPSRGLNRDILLEKLCGQLLRTARCPKLQVAVVWRPRLRTRSAASCPTIGLDQGVNA